MYRQCLRISHTISHGAIEVGIKQDKMSSGDLEIFSWGVTYLLRQMIRGESFRGIPSLVFFLVFSEASFEGEGGISLRGAGVDGGVVTGRLNDEEVAVPSIGCASFFFFLLLVIVTT